LKALAKHFSEQYPEPETLSVFVATDTSQFASYASEGTGKRPDEMHPSGGYTRRKGNEFIRIQLPDEKMKTIVLKGTANDD
jgi:hypothetical protein